MPVTGAGTSALTLSVSTSSIGSNSTTLSPGLTSHLEIVPSCTDSPSCGITTRVVVAISVRCELLQCTRDLFGSRHERLLHRGRVGHGGHIEPAESLHRRVEPAPRLVGDERRDLRPDRDAEVVFVKDEALAGLPRRSDDRLLVQRVDRAKVDDLDADAALCKRLGSLLCVLDHQPVA